MSFIQQRLPQRHEISYVLGASVFVIFSWSLRGFFELLPSFLRNQSPGAIFGIFSYMMAFALLESLLLAGGLVLASMILPGKWYRDGFAYKGFLTVLVLAISLIQLQKYLTDEWPGKDALLPGVGIAFLVLISLILLARFFNPLQKLFLEVADRLQIFLYVYVPVGILGFLVVVIRNLILV